MTGGLGDFCNLNQIRIAFANMKFDNVDASDIFKELRRIETHTAICCPVHRQVATKFLAWSNQCSVNGAKQFYSEIAVHFHSPFWSLCARKNMVSILYQPAKGNAMNNLDESSFQEAADQLGCDPAAVKAIVNTESEGSSRLPDGRPKILFERHKFYQALDKKGQDAAGISTTNPDICSTARGGYKGGTAEWDRFTRASAIDSDAAKESTSWGGFQIMGFQWRILGFSSVSQMVDLVNSGPDGELQVFVAYCKATPALLTGLRSHDWAMVAKAYNGSSYKENQYDTKLAKAFAIYS